MKFSFPTKSQFVQTLEAVPKKVGMVLRTEYKTLKQSPLGYLKNGYIKNGRALGGIGYLLGDLSLPASPTANMFLKAVGLISAPATLLFMLEPLLGRKFGTNDQQQPIIPIGSYNFNTTRIAYNTMGVSCVGLALDGLSKIATHGWPAIVQTGCTAIAAWGCFQAGKGKKKSPNVVDESVSARKNIVTRTQDKILNAFSETSNAGKMLRDNELMGTCKLLVENIPMITSALVMQDYNLLRAYMGWTSGNIVLSTRRGLEILSENKTDMTQATSPIKAKTLILDKNI